MQRMGSSKTMSHSPGSERKMPPASSHMREAFLSIGWKVASILLLIAQPVKSASVSIDVDAEPAQLLSSYNLFRDAKRQIPNDGVIPYDLNTPHFADYATLHRFVWMPDGRSCKYGPHGEIEFPVGSVLVITMGYQTDLREPALGEHIVETRLWLRRSVKWVGAQYAWNKATTEAQLVVAGEKIDVSWIHHDGQQHHHVFRIPNRNQCIQCHEISDELIPLGPIHAQYLNKDYDYQDGTLNQLERWTQVGYLTGLPKEPDQIPRMAVWNDPATGDLDSRARAYLDMNCSSCHRKGGIGFTSGLDLRYDQREAVKFGIFSLRWQLDEEPVTVGLSLSQDIRTGPSSFFGSTQQILEFACRLSGAASLTMKALQSSGSGLQKWTTRTWSKDNTKSTCEAVCSETSLQSSPVGTHRNDSPDVFRHARICGTDGAERCRLPAEFCTKV
jgi:uncharacterized repeat protein (TIGR03806 family)